MPSVSRRRLRPAAVAATSQSGKIRILMEKRAILAAMLMAGLLMVYQLLFVKPEPPRQPGQANQKEAPVAPAGAPASPDSVPSAPAPPPVPPPAREVPQAPERAASVETPLYRAEVSSKGGEIKAWQLNYRGQKPMV